ncbi:hypothetical protein C8Q80DRAFT_1094372 [Daedaleopsis nitida]|nr:hypothetical protein C8Q80DRAFT_1094372 [Daedaleopsis nitida]
MSIETNTISRNSPASRLSKRVPQGSDATEEGGGATSIKTNTTSHNSPSTNSWENSEEFKEDPCAAYMSHRQNNSRDVISRAAYKTIIMEALSRKQREVMDALVADAEYMCHHGLGSRGANCHIALILLKHVAPRRFLSKTQILKLIRAIHDVGHLSEFTITSAAKVSLAALAYEPDEEVDRELLPMLKGLLVSKLPPAHERRPFRMREVWEETSNGQFLPIVVWPLFRLMLAFARRGEQTDASEIMAGLLEGQRIDNRAINATDLEAKDYVYVVLSVLVRACLNSGWFARSSTLLCPTVASRERVSIHLSRLVEDWLVAALDNPGDHDLAEAASMLIILMERADDYVVPNELLQRFYSEAAKADKGELVQAVYRHSRDIEGHSYRPPRGNALAWFGRYLRAERRDVHLSRVLAKQVVDENIYVEPSVRGSLLYNTAAFSFTLQTRALWERWSTGAERSYVVCMSATMLRIVSAFVNGAAATRRAAMRKPPTPPDETRINGLEEAAGRAGDQEEDAQTDAQETETRSTAQTEGDHPASDIPPPSSTPSPHRDDSDHTRSADPAALAPREEPEELTREELLARAEDIRRFADKVYDAYCEARTPFETADRFTLNAIARGAFMLDRDAEAFQVFELMKARDIRLDLHDLNVVISVVAKADPAAGLARIEKMVAAGLRPDAITYGTVIHWAIFHGDAPLVGRVIEMARAHGLQEFSFKTLAALVHAAVQPEFAAAGGVGEGAQLAHVDDVVGTMLDMGILPTPNVGRDCVKAALLADDPVRAFGFWKELLKDKVEWADAGWTAVRARIARKIRQHYTNGWLDERRARVMLSELGYDLVLLHLRRQMAARVPPLMPS